MPFFYDDDNQFDFNIVDRFSSLNRQYITHYRGEVYFGKKWAIYQRSPKDFPEARPVLARQSPDRDQCSARSGPERSGNTGRYDRKF